jgi:hypothetical protein
MRAAATLQDSHFLPWSMSGECAEGHDDHLPPGTLFALVAFEYRFVVLRATENRIMGFGSVACPLVKAHASDESLCVRKPRAMRTNHSQMTDAIQSS